MAEVEARSVQDFSRGLNIGLRNEAREKAVKVPLYKKLNV
jgi:hypothetical protein